MVTPTTATKMSARTNKLRAIVVLCCCYCYCYCRCVCVVSTSLINDVLEKILTNECGKWVWVGEDHFIWLGLWEKLGKIVVQD
jgi:hypothetical protein